MSLHLNPTPADPGEPDSRSASAQAGGAEIRPGVGREGVHVLAHGALVCPDCDLPIVISAPIPAGRQVECAACGSSSRAHELVARDVYDTVANEVYVIGRVPRSVVHARRPGLRRSQRRA